MPYKTNQPDPAIRRKTAVIEAACDYMHIRHLFTLNVDYNTFVKEYVQNVCHFEDITKEQFDQLCEDFKSYVEHME